jgi:hypothetical protein
MVRNTLRSFFARILPFQAKPKLTATKLHMLDYGTSPQIRRFDTLRWLETSATAPAPTFAALVARLPPAKPGPDLRFLHETFQVESDSFNAMRQAFRAKQQPAPKPPPSPAVSALSGSDFDTRSLSAVSSLDD